MLRDAALVAIVALMFLSGLQAAPGALVRTLDDRALLGRAVAVNVIVVPLLAFVIVRAFALPPPIRVGIMLMALAPGIPFLIKSAGGRKGGDDPFALTLSFVLPAISVVTLPIWALILDPSLGGVHLYAARSVVTILLAQLVPLLAGVAIARRSERIRVALVRPVSIIATLALVVLVLLIVIPGGKALASVFGTRAIIAILCLLFLSSALGWWFGGPTRDTRHTLAIGTELRNAGLAATLAATLFPGPDVVSTVIAFLILQIVVAFVLGTIFARRVAAARAPTPAA
jgi:bile acid:Na+ symporter, BASS family